MSIVDNATDPDPVTARGPGLLLGLVGITAFSFSFPATRLALADLDPWLVGLGRAAIAALLALVYLRATRAPRPTAAHWRRLAIVAAGVVIGFPLLSGLALTSFGAAHGAVVVAILPAATALAAVARAGERPGPGFWLAAGAGLAVVLAFTLHASGGRFSAGDGLLLAAVAACAVGYAEGGALARELGGARTICWALVLAAPLTLPLTLALAAATGIEARPSAWIGFGYVSAVSMFLGFFAWYAGLARGGVARVGQVQLSQPLLTFCWAALVLGEELTPWMLIAAVGVLASVAATQRARVRTVSQPRTRPAAPPAHARARS